MKVKLTKLRESENPLHPHNITEGHEVIGDYMGDPKVGEMFLLDGEIEDDWGYHTSTVQEIIDDKTFRTHNSIYKWEKIDG